MGGRGTFAAGRPVAFQYETVGEIDGGKILEPIDKKRSRRLPEESHSERAYIKLIPKGRTSSSMKRGYLISTASITKSTNSCWKLGIMGKITFFIPKGMNESCMPMIMTRTNRVSPGMLQRVH